jgi:hypothetical protein
MTAGIPNCDTSQFMPPNTGSSIPLNRWRVLIVDSGDATEAVRLRAALGNDWGKIELIEGLNELLARLKDLVKPQLVVLLHKQFGSEWFNSVSNFAEKRPKILFLGVGQEVPPMSSGDRLAESLWAMEENPTSGFVTHATWKQLEDPKSLRDLLQRLGEIHSRRHRGPEKMYLD